MRRGMIAVLLCAASAFCAPSAMSQSTATPRTPAVTHKSTPPTAAPANVPLKPFTANYQLTITRSPAAAAPVTEQETQLIARDSQQRRVVATTPAATQKDPNPVTHVSLSDPVARTNSNWAIPGKEVTVTPFPQPGARTSCNPPSQHAPAPKPTVQDLGKQTIQGIETEGKRITVAVPATAKEPAMTRITEEWTATDPGLRGFVARETVDEEPMVKSSQELENFQEGDPNPAFFQPPADYQVVNKPAPGSNCPANQTAPAIQKAPPKFKPIAPPPPA